MTYQIYNAHTSPIFKDLGLLKLNDIIFVHTVAFVYKSLNQQLLTENDFHLLLHTFNTRGAQQLLRIPYYRTKFNRL